jgi:hypothetical protein
MIRDRILTWILEVVVLTISALFEIFVQALLQNSLVLVALLSPVAKALSQGESQG